MLKLNYEYIPLDALVVFVQILLSAGYFLSSLLKVKYKNSDIPKRIEY